jgi:uncharacterized protein YndB with AHSA1/START domain
MATSVGVETEGTVQIEVHVNASVSAVWNALTSRDGTAVWLGPGAVLGDKGQSYRCDDGSYGVVRTFHPLEQLRLTWHAAGGEPGSMIEVDVTPVPSGTRLRLWHEGLHAAGRELMRPRWSAHISALLRLAEADRGEAR